MEMEKFIEELEEKITVVVQNFLVSDGKGIERVRIDSDFVWGTIVIKVIPEKETK